MRRYKAPLPPFRQSHATGASRLRLGMVAIALGTALSPASAWADGFTVLDGQTVGLQQMYDADQIGIIEAGGAIEVSGVNGVEMYGSPQTLENYGSITVLAGGGYGVLSPDDVATINNFGTVSTQYGIAIYTSGDGTIVNNAGSIVTNGSNAHGLYGIGNTVTMSNSGIIDVSGDYAKGIYVAGDDNIIVNDGEITTNGYDGGGIVAEGANVDVTNTGSISTSGQYSNGMVAKAANATLTNSGNITTYATNSDGMSATAAHSTLVNTGTIRTYDYDSAGMVVSDSDSTITNLGTIATSGYGLRVAGSNASVLNAGTITFRNYGAMAIEVTGENANIVNTGTIDLGDYGVYGLYSNVDGTTLTNTGTILANVPASSNVFSLGDDFTFYNSGEIINDDDIIGYSLFSDGLNSKLYNSGLIYSKGFDAVSLTGAGGYLYNSGRIIGTKWDGLLIVYSTLDNSGYITGPILAISARQSTLNFLSGSVVDGGVDIRETGNKLGFGSGLNMVLSYSGTGTVDAISSANPYVTSGKTVAVLDRAGLVLSDDMLMALADGVEVAAGTGSTACVESLRTPEGSCAGRAWISGFGSRGHADGTDDLAGRDWSDAGVSAGLDIDAGGGLSAGAFVAALDASGEVGSSQDTDMHGGALGAHLGYASGGLFARLSASYGLINIASARSVADNTVSGGLSSATADSNASFISPSLTAGADIAVGATVLTPSLRLRYTHLAIDGYAETGANDDLVVDDRSLDELALRAQLALAFTPILTEEGELRATLRAGADGSRRTGDDVSANLLGSDIAFASGSAGDAYGGFLGSGLAYETSTGITLGGDLEYRLSDGGSRSTTLRASLSAQF